MKIIEIQDVPIKNNKPTYEKHICIICERKHNTKFINKKQKVVTNSFCSKKCLRKAKKVPIIGVNQKGFLEFLNLFREEITIKDSEKWKYISYVNTDLVEGFKK